MSKLLRDTVTTACYSRHAIKDNSLFLEKATLEENKNINRGKKRTSITSIRAEAPLNPKNTHCVTYESAPKEVLSTQIKNADPSFLQGHGSREATDTPIDDEETTIVIINDQEAYMLENTCDVLL